MSYKLGYIKIRIYPCTCIEFEQVRTWQDDSKLRGKVELLRKISQRINAAIKERDIVIQENGAIKFNNETIFEI